MGPARGRRWPDSPARPEQERSTIGVRWSMHWDPHPVCWLHATLTHAPYQHRGLGMRTCPTGGIAITLPDNAWVIGVEPVDPWHVAWTVLAHHPSTDRHQPVAFGQFTWTGLNRGAVEWASSTLLLPDGSKLTLAARARASENRFRIESRTVPGRVVPGTDTWADLPAVEHIAARVHAWLTHNGEPADKPGGHSSDDVPPP